MKEMLKSVWYKYEEMFKRAGRTFLQAFMACVAANIVKILSEGSNDFNYLIKALEGLGISAVAAGIAAVMNKPKKDTGEQ